MRLKEIITSILTTLITSGIAWMIYTLIELKEEVKLMDYKIDQINLVVQDVSEK